MSEDPLPSAPARRPGPGARPPAQAPTPLPASALPQACPVLRSPRGSGLDPTADRPGLRKGGAAWPVCFENLEGGSKQPRWGPVPAAGGERGGTSGASVELAMALAGLKQERLSHPPFSPVYGIENPPGPACRSLRPGWGAPLPWCPLGVGPGRGASGQPAQPLAWSASGCQRAEWHRALAVPPRGCPLGLQRAGWGCPPRGLPPSGRRRGIWLRLTFRPETCHSFQIGPCGAWGLASLRGGVRCPQPDGGPGGPQGSSGLSLFCLCRGAQGRLELGELGVGLVPPC